MTIRREFLALVEENDYLRYFSSRLVAKIEELKQKDLNSNEIM